MTPWEALSTVVGSFGVCFAASFLPVGGGVEVYLLATSAILPTGFVAPLVLASAAGSVAAKTIIFLGAAKAARRPNLFKDGSKGAGFAKRIQDGPWIRRGVILLASTISVPPYYAMAIAAGALKTPLTEFIVLSMIGQSARFGAVWAIPQIAGSMAGG